MSTHQLIIRPRLNFSFAGDSHRPYLHASRTYKAHYASNQPNWERRGKIFVKGMLLLRDEYTIVSIRQSIKAYKRELLQACK